MYAANNLAVKSWKTWLCSFFSSNCQKGHENPVSHFTLIAGVWRQKGKNKNDFAMTSLTC